MRSSTYFFALFTVIVISCENNNNTDEYSDSSFVTKEVRIMDASDSLTSTYIYDDSLLISNEVIGQTKILYEYNDTSVIAESRNQVGDIEQVIIYSIENHLAISAEILSTEAGSDDMAASGVTILFHYDNDNHLVETLYFEDSELALKYVNTWDSNGDLIKSDAFLEDDEEPYFTEEYTYYTELRDYRQYGLLFQGERSAHLIKTEKLFIEGEMMTSYTCTYDLDALGRPVILSAINEVQGFSFTEKILFYYDRDVL